MNLTVHFTLEAFTRSATAERLGINNTPSKEVIQNLTTTAEGLEKVRGVLQLHNEAIEIDSGFRCEALEKVLTQKDFASWCARHDKHPWDWVEYFSRKPHPKGYAVDFVCPAVGTPLEIVKKLAESDLQFDQLIQEGSWVHISFDPRMRREVLTAQFSPTGVNYTRGL